MHHTCKQLIKVAVNVTAMAADICQLQLLALQHDISNTLQIAQDVLHMGQLDHQIEEVPDQEWVNAMKVYICPPFYLLSPHYTMHK